MFSNNKVKFLIILLIFIISYRAYSATSYIEGTIISVSSKTITVKEKSKEKINISINNETAFYDSSKPYGPEARVTYNEINPQDTAVFSVKILPEGKYFATGIIFLPAGEKKHLSWEEKMNSQTTSSGISYNSNQGNTVQPDTYNTNTSPQNYAGNSHGTGELVNTQGVVTSIDSASLTIQTMEGQTVKGTLYPQTLVYDLSQGFNLESNSAISSIGPGDVVGISYYKEDPQKLIEAVMFLPQGGSLDASWESLYNQIQGGTFQQ